MNIIFHFYPTIPFQYARQSTPAHSAQQVNCKNGWAEGLKKATICGEPRSILRHLQAFLCLYDWLYQRNRIDITRKLTFFVDPFPESYLRKVIAPDYRPDLDTLIDDYLAENATRNRDRATGHDVDPVLYAAEPEVEPRYDAKRDLLERELIELTLRRRATHRRTRHRRDCPGN